MLCSIDLKVCHDSKPGHPGLQSAISGDLPIPHKTLPKPFGDVDPDVIPTSSGESSVTMCHLAMLIPTSSRRHRGSHLSPCVHPRRRPRCIPQSAHKLSVPWRHCARLDGVIVPGSTASLCPAFIQTDVPPAFVFFFRSNVPQAERERAFGRSLPLVQDGGDERE